jgi:hypothetical protein
VRLGREVATDPAGVSGVRREHGAATALAEHVFVF